MKGGAEIEAGKDKYWEGLNDEERDAAILLGWVEEQVGKQAAASRHATSHCKMPVSMPNKSTASSLLLWTKIMKST